MHFNADRLSVEAVIFDLDGTLIDSAGIYFKIVEIVFERLDLPQPSRKAILDATEDGDFDWYYVLPVEVRDRKDEIITKALHVINEIAPQMFRDDVKLIPGADKLMREISASGMKIGLVTSTSRQRLEFKLEPLRSSGVDKLLEVIITTDDVQNKKPAADALLKCGKRLSVSLSKSIYVGDTRVDIRAGKAAGMKTIGVLTGFDDYELLKKEDPDVIINSVDELRKVIILQPET